MIGVWLYAGVAVWLGVSWMVDRERTARTVRAALGKLWGMAPMIAAILWGAGFMMARLDTTLVIEFLGTSSGLSGVGVGFGALVHVPSFVAYPLAADLIEQGAGRAQVGAFLSVLMGVSVTTLPLEIRYFGPKVTLARNGMCVSASLALAWALSV